ncbi:acyl-CoA dehydrogenase family protein [Rhodococcus fascians]|nr:acyl-CoA dehydrogenase family protein [Rhodococcus fascians]MBY4238733.1 acyl-CoA dehydrogenase family protein [Rhodococcus fascians]MBY4254678.1 acyl-CoA dehydrogenase family protein [Rhodococcus fascians]MBY4270088.1 acyl-CoA dehydrogenase family protein [Rhodococcus fascians]
MSVDFELPTRYESIRDRARDLALQIAPIAGEADESDCFVPEVRSALAASGLTALMVPAEYGGNSEKVDSLAATVVREQLAAECGHLDSMFAMQGIGSFALSQGGDEVIKKQWLPLIGTMEAVAALALTEPDIGSDLKNLSTTVIADGEDLIIDGHKSFITNAGDADFYCVLGKEDSGYSLVLVPTDTVGVTVSKPHRIIAPHVMGDVVFDQVRVPARNRLGEPGKGFPLVLATLATFRVSVAGASMGLAESALKEALRHAQSREMFGTTLSKIGDVPSKLAWSWTEIEMVRSLTYRAAAASARDPLANLHLSSMAKIAATETAGTIADRCVQIMGRFGLVQGGKMERLYREARPMRIYEGSTEVILDSLARQLLKRGL